MRHATWSHKPPVRRPRRNGCITNHGLAKFTHQEKGSAQREAFRLGGRASYYWCELHDGWHVGKTPKVPGRLERHLDLVIELGERVTAAMLSGDRYADPREMHRVITRLRSTRGEPSCLY